MAKIVLDVVPKYLRKCFVDEWNRRYDIEDQKWKSNSSSGMLLFSNLPTKIKNSNNPNNKMNIEKLKSGNENSWDTTTLVFVMLYSGLNLIQGCRPKVERTAPLRLSEEIDIIREVRNEYFAHAAKMPCQSSDFADIIAKIRSVAASIFHKDAQDEIDQLIDSHIETKMTVHLRKQLDLEINCNKNFNSLIEELKGNFPLTIYLDVVYF